MHDLDSSDFRATLPRFQADALAHNLQLLELVKRIAEGHGATPAQIALAWLLAKAPFVVPIPGTTKLHRLEENLGASEVVLTEGDVAEIEALLAQVTVEGGRYTPAGEAMTGL